MIDAKVVDMEMSQVESRMRGCGMSPGILKFFNEEGYKKLAYAIGKELDLQILRKQPWKSGFPYFGIF